ncbi:MULTISPECIES: ABC transporter ATP-binding protein [Rhizobium]|jgi:iron(III) transport system ATP-binding protein|uniref:ABC transporter ATP-binding protein n=1 Tax=Rhizobium anhuiense TaxID=1184720 RepID=A0A432NED2_9HYPH|nr:MULTISPECIES: ABC transporter ATP-binding protein [Rhizobium]KZS55647.1 sugar ABC transporter [Rhizobium anhuiense bv. trifolii]MBB3301327.1 iron(III) transport system ATP-binding protein [Rhizobium sp. BK112]MBB3370449.1 iron(III) transport system ATP-binding protein [Rhizobium sp. BK077]MBB4114721.1 iron(III) transport system ATP-binding protein [Rhizobium sp. BK226]MBB4181382.1 iron(III) transport system ATP-binding protein [Rhizobium sp. BK109]
MTLLTIENISKRYGPVQALKDISLDVSAGSRTAVVGPSGSGKTTLLRIIAGFEQPDVGRVTLDGDLLADGPAAVPAHKRGIGIVSQDGALFPHLSVAENIGFGFERGAADREKRILELLDMVELDRGMLARRPHQLSGGQQQRVALARALGRKPRLMLLDEPFSALDTGLRENMRKAVARVLQAAGITTILVTHDQEEALTFADQVAVLREGRLIQAGSPQSLYLHPRDRETALFLGDAVLLPAIIRNGLADCALGRVAVEGSRQGKAEIMLRPEQIRVVADESDRDYGGRVVEVEFGGAVCTVAVSLDGVALPPILIKTSSVALPARGDLVRLDIAGKAHVFEN